MTIKYRSGLLSAMTSIESAKSEIAQGCEVAH
jgi:hypothetical protein